MSVDAVTKDDMSEAIELQDRVVCNEIDHRMLSDVVDHRHSWQGQFEEEARESDEDNHCVEKRCHAVTLKSVCAHHIFPMPQDVQHDECHDEYTRDAQGGASSHLFDEPSPCTSHIEEEHAHWHIAQTHR